MQVQSTDVFDKWLAKLRNGDTRARVVARIRRLQDGNPGDTKSVGGDIFEMRISYGPGLRVYYIHRGSMIVMLLCGGDKGTQSKDIARARVLAAELDEDRHGIEDKDI